MCKGKIFFDFAKLFFFFALSAAHNKDYLILSLNSNLTEFELQKFDCHVTHVPLCTNANCQTFPVMTSFKLIGKQSFMGKNDSFSNFWGNSFNFYRAKRKQHKNNPPKIHFTQNDIPGIHYNEMFSLILKRSIRGSHCSSQNQFNQKIIL